MSNAYIDIPSVNEALDEQSQENNAQYGKYPISCPSLPPSFVGRSLVASNNAVFELVTVCRPWLGATTKQRLCFVEEVAFWGNFGCWKPCIHRD